MVGEWNWLRENKPQKQAHVWRASQDAKDVNIWPRIKGNSEATNTNVIIEKNDKGCPQLVCPDIRSRQQAAAQLMMDGGPFFPVDLWVLIEWDPSW